MAQPFYHLRPNKYVDRCLFVTVLERLDSLMNLRGYSYIGFGSYMFDDFKIIHDRLNIAKMISLESDPYVQQRAQYNVPYKCINIVNKTSTVYISDGECEQGSKIIWLDYTDPKDLAQQFSDLSSLKASLNSKDIIRITLNANVSSLGAKEVTGGDSRQKQRLDKLNERIGEYVPIDTTTEDMFTNNYPLLLLRCLHKMLGEVFMETKFDKRFVLPLFSTIYQDGQMMLTMTFMVLDDHEFEQEVRRAFRDITFVNFEWDKPARITIPELTIKEIIEMNKLLPSDDAQKQLNEKFEFIFNKGDTERDEKINSYVNFYKYYPNYQSINF